MVELGARFGEEAEANDSNPFELKEGDDEE
jgi:hypothetical protein